MTQDEAQASLDKVVGLVDNLHTILDDLRAHYKPFVRRSQVHSTGDIKAIDHVAELETIAGESPDETDGTAMTIMSEGDEVEEVVDTEESVVDNTLQEMGPTESFTESQVGTALSEKEGQIIQSFLLTLPRVRETSALIETPDMAAKREASWKELMPEAVSDSKAERLSEGELSQHLDDLMVETVNQQKSYAHRLALPSKHDHSDCRELLTMMGVPVLEAVAPYEAEGLASSLANSGLVDYVGTEDSDVLAYGVSPCPTVTYADHLTRDHFCAVYPAGTSFPSLPMHSSSNSTSHSSSFSTFAF